MAMMEYWREILLVMAAVLLLFCLWQGWSARRAGRADGEAMAHLVRSIMETEFRESRRELLEGLRVNRQEMAQSLREFRVELNDIQRQKFSELVQKQDELVKATAAQLEKMRETVDEKLHKTLEERLGQSFQLVSERLEAVQKGLGEMQTLALGVGDLKKC